MSRTSLERMCEKACDLGSKKIAKSHAKITRQSHVVFAKSHRDIKTAKETRGLQRGTRTKITYSHANHTSDVMRVIVFPPLKGETQITSHRHIETEGERNG